MILLVRLALHFKVKCLNRDGLPQKKRNGSYKHTGCKIEHAFKYSVYTLLRYIRCILTFGGGERAKSEHVYFINGMLVLLLGIK